MYGHDQKQTPNMLSVWVMCLSFVLRGSNLSLLSPLSLSFLKHLNTKKKPKRTHTRTETISSVYTRRVYTSPADISSFFSQPFCSFVLNNRHN